MKYLTTLSILIALTTAQVTVVVDPSVNILDAVPDIASIGDISPTSTSSKIVVTVDGDCTTAEKDLEMYNPAGCV